MRLRPLTALYERGGVDLVFSGHIHSYERTFPIAGGRSAEKGPIYVVCGGGGGSLETHGPTRAEWSARVRHGHHYVSIAATPRRLELFAYDREGRLFDQLVLEKGPAR